MFESNKMFESKNFPLILSLFAVFFVLGYIRYANSRMDKSLASVEKEKRLEDGTLAPADLDETDMQPLPAITFDLPDSLSFAGEIVPMELTDVRERLDKELHINTYWHNNT